VQAGQFETRSFKSYVKGMTLRRLYLDWNATAPVSEAVREAVTAALMEAGNASSVHSAGRAAHRRLEEARAAVAALVEAAPQELVFTSGGTEANNLALKGTACASLIVSAVEHDSVRGLVAHDGRPQLTCPVDEAGRVNLEALASLLKEAPSPALVSVMLANNETGVIQPVAEAAELAHAHGGLIHCDAIQGPGRLSLNFRELGLDLASLSGHKLGAPQGVGALWIREGLEIKPLFDGGGQELRRRAGTEPLPAIAGFGAAARESIAHLQEAPRIRALRDRMESAVLETAPDAWISGAHAERLVNTSSLAMPGMAAETQVMGFDLEGICVSAGSACSSGKLKASHVLAAMGVPDETAACAIRVSLGHSTSDADVDRFVAAWRKLFERTRGRSRPTAVSA